MSDTMAIEPHTPIEKLSLTSDKVEGIESLKLDDEVTLTIKAKVLRIGKSVYSEEDKKRPQEAEFEILSGTVGDKADDTVKKMGDAKDEDELDKIAKEAGL
jgi:hypothetical protein